MSGGHFRSSSDGRKRPRESEEKDENHNQAGVQSAKSTTGRRVRKLLNKLKNEDLSFDVHEQSREGKDRSPLITLSRALDKSTDKVLKTLAAKGGFAGGERDVESTFQTFHQDAETRQKIMKKLVDAFNVSASVYSLAIGKRDDEPFTAESYGPRDARDAEAGGVLYFASFKGRLYRLVSADSSGAQWNADGYASGSDAEEEQHDDAKLQTYKDIGNLEREPFTWLECSSCKKWRIVTRAYCKRHKYDVLKSQSFNCCNTEGMFEAKCQDAGIWSLVYQLLACSGVKEQEQRNEHRRKGGESNELQVKRDIAAYRRMLKSRNVYPDSPGEPSSNDPFIDISYLFIAVRSFGSLEGISHGYLKKIAQDQLGMQGRGCVKALKRFYKELFGHVVGHDTLEVHLIKNLQVRHMITLRQEEIFDDLGLIDLRERKERQLEWTSKATGKDMAWEILAQSWRDGEVLPSFVDESLQVYRSEDVEQMLNFCIERVDKLIRGLKLSHETFFVEVADSFGDFLREASSVAQQHQEERKKLLMVGRPRAGKSFTIDCCLRMSELNTHVYRARNAPPVGQEGRPKDEFTTAFVDGITIVEKHNKILEVQDQAADAMQTDEDDGKRLRLDRFVAQQSDLDRFGMLPDGGGMNNSPIFEREKKSVEAFREYHKVVAKSDVNIGELKRKIQPFLLPQAQPGESTTACSISVRRSDRYQVILKYKSLDGLVSDWLTGQRSKVSSKELRATSGKEDDDWAEDVLSDEETIREFLNSEDAAHLTGEHGVLSRVLVFSGAGEDALLDRIFVRRIMHHAQGVRDDTTSGYLVPPPGGGDALHPLVSGDCANAKDWGFRTRIALEQIILYSPSQMAPGRHGEWIDTPGVGDDDPIKRDVFERDLARADAVICLVKETNISNDEPLANALRKSKVMRNIVNSAVDPEGTPSVSEGRIAILHVIEQERGNDLRDESCTGACDLSDQSVRCNSCTIKNKTLEHCRDIAKELADGQDLKWKGSTKEKKKFMKASVKLLLPFVMRFSSIMLDPRSSTQELKRLEVYEVLGSVEQFLRSSVSRQAERVQEKKKALINDLDNLALTLAEELGDTGSSTDKEQLCWSQLHDVFLMGEEGLAKSLESYFLGGGGVAEWGKKDVDKCRQGLVNMFQTFKDQAKAPDELYASMLLLNDFLDASANAVKKDLEQKVEDFTALLKRSFCREMLGIISPKELDKTRMEEKLSSLGAFIDGNGGLRQIMFDMVKKLVEHASSSEVQNKVREHVMSQVAKYTGSSLKERVLGNIEAAHREGAIRLALILRHFLCANYSDPFSAAQGAAPLSSLFNTIKKKWLRQAMRHARRGFKDSATAQSEIARRRSLLDNIRKNLEEFAKTLKTACDNLESEKGLDVIGKLCSDDFRLQRQREYFAQETEAKKNMLAVQLPAPGPESAKLGIDGNYERKEGFHESGFERIKPRPLLDALEGFKNDKTVDGDLIWTAKQWPSEVILSYDDLNDLLKDLDVEPRLKLAALRVDSTRAPDPPDILTMCAKMIAPEDADLESVKAQVRLAVTSHAMEWHDEVQGKSLDEYQLWDRTKTDEISRFCDQLSDLHREPPELDLRFVLVLASYLQLPLHVYLYNMKHPWRVEPWKKDRAENLQLDEDPKKALAIAFLGYKFKGSGQNQKEGVWQACIVDQSAEKIRMAKEKEEKERIDALRREQDRLKKGQEKQSQEQRQVKRRKNDAGEGGGGAGRETTEVRRPLVADGIQSRAQHDLGGAADRMLLQLLSEDSRGGSAYFEGHAQMDAQIEENIRQIEQEVRTEAAREIEAGTLPQAVPSIQEPGPQYHNKMLQMSRWKYKRCSDGKKRFSGPGVVPNKDNKDLWSYEEADFNKLVKDYPQFGRRFGVKDGKRQYKTEGGKRVGPKDIYVRENACYFEKHPTSGGLVLMPAPACDEEFGMEDNMLSVFDGYYTGDYVSGYLARKLARVCRQESAVVLKHDPPPNMSRRIVDRAFHKVKDIMRSEFDPGPKQRIFHANGKNVEDARTNSQWRIASCTGAVVTLVQNKMHAWQIGDTLWALLRMKGATWKVEELSLPDYNRSERLCNQPVYQDEFRAYRQGKIKQFRLCACDKGQECNPVPNRLILGTLEESLRKGIASEPVQVQEGDMVIIGSNGIFDNLKGGKPHDNFKLKATIEGIVAEARRSLPQDSVTPFEEHLGRFVKEEAEASMYKQKFVKNGVAPRSSDCTVVVASITLTNQAGGRFEECDGPKPHSRPPGTYEYKFRKSEPRKPLPSPAARG